MPGARPPWSTKHMPNVLPLHARVSIIRGLVEGISIRATGRLTHTKKDTVMKLGLLIGLGCMKLHDRHVTKVRYRNIEIDEVWAYVGVHEKRKTKKHPGWFGDVYTLFAIDAQSKLVPSYITGKRTLPMATRFMEDLRKRTLGKPQLSVDGWPPWVEAIRRAFGWQGADAGAIVKEYQRPWGARQVGAGSYGRVKSTKRSVIYGEPKHDLISTAIAERLNLTTRMQQRRLTRLTNAYSKKKVNLVAAVGLHFFHYNFCREHEALKTTPAMAAGIADHPWTLEELVLAALEAMGETQPEPPKLYPSSYKRKRHVLTSISA